MTMKRQIRDRRLTPDESAKYRAIRDDVDLEKPEIKARIRGTIAEQGKSKGEVGGHSTLGQRICSARKSRGDSQATLANAVGISPDDLVQIENDQREPTLSVAARLAAALRISLDELASGLA